jgi:hypothetical protein
MGIVEEYSRMKMPKKFNVAMGDARTRTNKGQETARRAKGMLDEEKPREKVKKIEVERVKQPRQLSKRGGNEPNGSSLGLYEAVQ